MTFSFTRDQEFPRHSLKYLPYMGARHQSRSTLIDLYQYYFKGEENVSAKDEVFYDIVILIKSIFKR